MEKEKIAILVDHHNLREVLNNGYQDLESRKNQKLIQEKKAVEIISTPVQMSSAFLSGKTWERNGKMIKYRFWETLHDVILQAYSDQRYTPPQSELYHTGTWLFISERPYPVDKNHKYDEEEAIFLKEMRKVDSLFGYIVKYSVDNKAMDQKGTDVNLVCQMLIGAFHDEYDTCILLSDDVSFIPAINMAQNYMNKRIFHAGFTQGRLRAACYGNIPFEDGGFHLMFNPAPHHH